MPTDTPESRALVLAALLPAGTDRYIALFLGDPLDGGVELTLTGYARKAHQQWTTTDLGGSSERSNTTDITFATITQAGGADYWGIYDTAGPGGTLLRRGALLDNLQQPVAIAFSGLGDEARLPAGKLRIKATEI
jgi:hypothetical protein